MQELLRFENVLKKYRNKIILDHVDLSIEQGQSIAFIGHNGCGKSTLLKLSAHLIRPTTGKITYAKKLLIHYVPEHFPKSNLTMKEYLQSMAELDGFSKVEATARFESLVEDFFMTSMLDIPLKHLSKGSLQKVGVIQALLREPDVLLLDEPLSGQDAESQQVFIHKIKEIQEKGMTVLMSCHEPYLTQAISDTVYRIEDGKLRKVENDGNTDADRQKSCMYLLFFQKKNSGDPEEVCKRQIPEAQCDEEILTMLQDGWSLKGMERCGD